MTLDKDFNPLGFDFLACQGGAQHLSANLSGFRRSNKSKEMHFEEQSTLFRGKDDGDAASGKAFHLSVSLDPPSTRGAPRGAPSLHGLTAHLPSLPSPFTEERKSHSGGCPRDVLALPDRASLNASDLL